MGVKKLRSVFMLYALFLALAVFFLIAVNACIYLYCVDIGFIYPLASVDASINNAKEILQSNPHIIASDIPPFCEYVLYTKDGQYLDGSIDWESSSLIWNDCVEKGQMYIGQYVHTIFDREKEILVLRYRMTAQFGNSALRGIFPSADLLLVAVILLEILLSLIIISFIFGKNLGKKIDKLQTVV